MSSFTFREVQRFRQPWIWFLIVGSLGSLLGVFIYGLVQQLGKGEPWGSQPMSDTGLLATFLITLVLSLGLIWLFLVMALAVEVRSDCLHVHFKFLRNREVAYSDIARVEAVRYRPIVHYGGWGVRRGRKGWAYNVSGNRGVRLDFHDGQHLLLGSQRSVELAAAIEKARGR